MTVIIFILVLAVLVFVHELGHFLVAKACGIRADEFAIGFGPRLISKKFGETLYAINLIPFGGYVKIFGENPDDESINGTDKSRSIVHKSKLEQIAVLFAGIFFNFVFACILATIAFTVGVSASIDSYPQYLDRMKDSKITITYVSPDSPAYKAGLKGGDVLAYDSVESVQKTIASSMGKEISLKYIRNNNQSEIKVTPVEGIVQDKYAIGISMDNVATLKLPFYKSVIEGYKFTIYMISATVSGMYDLVAGMFNGQSKLSSVSGPVGIAGMVGDAAKLGFTYLIMFTAVISINLGVLNAVPFPALDGGRILFVIIEAIIRRPIKPIVANTINSIGFGLLILLMIFVTYKDIAKLFVK